LDLVILQAEIVSKLDFTYNFLIVVLQTPHNQIHILVITKLGSSLLRGQIQLLQLLKGIICGAFQVEILVHVYNLQQRFVF